MFENIADEFKFAKKVQTDTTEDVDHGRIETRKCSVIDDFQFIENQEKWKGLKSIIKIESIREFKNSDKPTNSSEPPQKRNIRKKRNQRKKAQSRL
ncbi:MAG: hypothetical protein QM564_05825 [Bergeyella sp.]